MLKKLPIKKDYMLIAGMAVIFLICYQLALKKTIAAWQVHKQLQTQLLQAADLNYQPAYLERKSTNLDKIISLYKADTLAFRSNILSTIAAIAENERVKLSEVPVQDPLYHTDKFIIEKLDFEGSFFSLTKLLNQLQSTKNIGMIRSLDYKIVGVKSNSDEVKKVVLEVYFEFAK